MSKKKARHPRTEAGPVRTPLPPGSESNALPFRIPPILFEGDGTEVASQTPEASSPSQIEEPQSGELAEARSSVQLLLLARDPHILYAHWNLTQAEQARFNSLSKAGRLVIRVSSRPEPAESSGSSVAAESFDVQMLPDSTHWFIHVDHAGSRYVAELGYYSQQGVWNNIATSATASTPPEHVSDDRSVRFGVIGPDGVLPNAGDEELKSQSEPTIKSPVVVAPELIGAIVPPRVSWIPALGIHPSEPHTTTVLASSFDSPSHIAGSEVAETHSALSPAAIADWLHREAEGEGMENLSSPAGQNAFWFKVGAELIVFGATEPSATVSLQGNPIRLSSAGTFACRLAFPDGEQELELVATSIEGQTRRVLIKVLRATGT